MVSWCDPGEVTGMNAGLQAGSLNILIPWASD